MSRIAMYRNIQYRYVNIEPEGYDKDHEDFVRISEFVEVEFEELGPEVTVPKEIEFHEKAKATVQTVAALEVEKIDDKIRNLQALTHQTDDDV